MGTNFKDNKKLSNRVTISKGSETPPRRVDPDTGETDRSFAQPNPLLPPREVKPQAHASVEDEIQALNANSTNGNTYLQEEDADDTDDTEE